MKTLIILFLFITMNLFSISLPVKKAKLTSTFGESRNDHFHNGVDFGGGEQAVCAVEDGRIIFYSDREEFPFNNYYGSGNYIIIEHKKTRSYYMHLKNKTVNKTNFEIKENSVIGRTSNTGHSFGVHLHFTLEKIQPIEILNPLLYFNEPIKDRIKPKIDKFMIKVDDSNPIIISKSYQIREGSEITLFIKTYDLIQNNNNKMGVYKIICYLNNEKLTEYVFDKLIVKNNYYYLPPNYSFHDIYYDKYIYTIGKFSLEEKKYSIKIVVEDLAGNKTQTERNLIIRK